MSTKSKCDRCRKPLYGLVACPACRESMIQDAIDTATAHPSPAAAPQTDTALTVERLAEALHSAIACNWRAHSGFTARTDREYHEQQASRILRALGEGAGEGVDRG